jgi:protein-disulfide isomerase
MNKRVILIVVGIIIAVVGFLYLTKPAEEASSSPSSHTFGQGSTGVVLVEYGDFQCPGCAAYAPVLSQIKAEYEDRITFQFRHFPLESIHVNARASSRAAEAASLQGKFWEMHDALFVNQTTWQEVGDPLSIFEGYAKEIGLDVARFTADYKSSAVNATINADLSEGRKLDIQSTPSFILDGEKLENPGASFEAFSAVIDEAIAKKTGTQPAQETTEQTPAITEETAVPAQ